MQVGRFIQTLEYFDVIPLCSWWRAFWRRERQKSMGIGRMGLILLVAKTRDIPAETIKELLDKGYRIKWVVPPLERDEAKVVYSYLPQVETVFLDINNSTDLNPQLLNDVESIIYLSDRDLNFGIVELIHLSDRYLQPNTEKTIFDFTKPSLEVSDTWGAIDDVVMGGVSDSKIAMVDGAALFSGNVSTANSGGFASIRTRNLEPHLDLSNYEGIELKFKGDGQRYKLFVRTNPGWDSLAYSYSFDTAYQAWLNVQIPFAEMVAVFRAKTVPSAPPIDLKEVCAFQIMLSKFEYDGQLNPHFNAGSFALEIASIKAYGGKELLQFILVKNGDISPVEEALKRSRLHYEIKDSFTTR